MQRRPAYACVHDVMDPPIHTQTASAPAFGRRDEQSGIQARSRGERWIEGDPRTKQGRFHALRPPWLLQAPARSPTLPPRPHLLDADRCHTSTHPHPSLCSVATSSNTMNLQKEFLPAGLAPSFHTTMAPRVCFDLGHPAASISSVRFSPLNVLYTQPSQHESKPDFFPPPRPPHLTFSPQDPPSQPVVSYLLFLLCVRVDHHQPTPPTKRFPSAIGKKDTSRNLRRAELRGGRYSFRASLPRLPGDGRSQSWTL